MAFSLMAFDADIRKQFNAFPVLEESQYNLQFQQQLAPSFVSS
jgi:hypothetical protein